MANVFHPHSYMSADFHRIKAKSSLWAVPIGRFFFSLIFIMSGLNHFTSGSIGYAASQGIPMADILVPVSGLIALMGGLSVLLGLHARVGAMLLLIFLIPVTVLMHNFWSYTDPEMAQVQMIHFMKNLALIGGATLIAFYGAGPISLDHRLARHNKS